MKDSICVKGVVTITKLDKNTGLKTVEKYKNLVMSGSGTGLNLIVNSMSPDGTGSLVITKLKIGTGTTPPTDSDTDIETSALVVTDIADTTIAQEDITFSFFVPDSELADGIYTELSLHTDTGIFARLLLSPTLTKSSGQDITIDYQIIYSN